MPRASTVLHVALAAIHFKNLVHQQWVERPADEGQTRRTLPAADKTSIRANLVRAIVVSPHRVRYGPDGAPPRARAPA